PASCAPPPGRRRHTRAGRAPAQPVTAAQWLAQGRPVLRGKPRPDPSPGEGTPGNATPGEGADRFVPVGLTIPFLAGAVSGELCLMSFAQTGTGARFIAAWQVH